MNSSSLAVSPSKKRGLKLKKNLEDSPVLGTERANQLVQKIVDSFVQGVDYGTIPGCKKPSLYKPGAEKPCLAFNLDPQFERDTEVLEMLKGVSNLVAVKCTLIARHTGKRVGEGRGSAILGAKANCADPNSTVKMAEKSAQIDAVLRTFALSGRFTQDVEDMKIQFNVKDNKGAKSTITIDNSTGEVKEVKL